MTTHKEARELAQRFGTRMCDENGDTHGEELYCLGLDDIIEMAKTLAQPEQEPVFWWNGGTQFATQKSKDWDKRTGGTTAFGCDIPLYTTPPQRKPLTDEQKQKIEAEWNGSVTQLINTIEAAHGIKGEA